MRLACILGVISLFCACGRFDFDARVDAGGDAGGDAAPRCTQFGPWSPPILHAELSSDGEEFAATISRDGSTIVFPSDRVGGMGMLDLYTATLDASTQTYSAPLNNAVLNTSLGDGSPGLSDDQLTLYFSSDRSGAAQLYTATRASETDEFGPPTLLPGAFTGLGNVGAPDLTPDELTLYFDADQGGAGGLDLWKITRASKADAWSLPMQVPGVDTPGTEAEPIIDDGELTLYYISDAFEAPQDFVVATRPDVASPFGPPTVVPLSLDPGVGEYGGDMSADGTKMVLSIHLGAPLKTNVFVSTRACL